MKEDTPTAGRFQGRLHLLPARIYYEDTDFTGLVYHANYLRFFERGRSDFLRLVGADHTSLGELDTALTLTDIAVKFRKAARIDDALVIQTAFDRLMGARVLISQTIARAGETLAEAQVTACCISMTGKARRPPQLLVDKLKPYLDTSPSMF